MERLGRYHLAGEISTGDFVGVHRGYLVTGGGVARPVWVKRILPRLASDAETISLLVEEARITSQLEHPAILGLVDIDQLEGKWMMATERVLGRSLQVVVAKTRERGVAVDAQVASYITIQILAALAHAHERTDARGDLLGIVHRDVCPVNVLLAYSGEVKLTSFAYAKIRGRSGGTHPRIEPRYAYMSPEQALGSEVDHRADVFGAGLILYELLIGRPAYETRSLHETLLAAQRGRLAPMAEAAPSVSPELAGVVDKALAFDRRMRHASAAVFRDELSRVLFQRDPTYGAHRLMSFMARVLGDEAFDDRLTEATERAELEAEIGAPGAGRAGSVRRMPAHGAAIPGPAISAGPISAVPASAAAQIPPAATTIPSGPPVFAATIPAHVALPGEPTASSAPPFGIKAASTSSPPPDPSQLEKLRTITATRFDPAIEDAVQASLKGAGSASSPAPSSNLGPSGLGAGLVLGESTGPSPGTAPLPARPGPPPPPPHEDVAAVLITQPDRDPFAPSPIMSPKSPPVPPGRERSPSAAPRVVGAPISPSTLGAPTRSLDPLALALGPLAPSQPRAPGVIPQATSSFAANATTVLPEPTAPLAFEKKPLPLVKIALGVVLLAMIGLGGFALSSKSNYRLVERRVYAAFVGRQPGGVLTIESMPSGARLTLDDEESGRKTPVTVENLESGVVHDLKLEIEGEKTVTSTIAIRPGAKQTITLIFPDAVIPLTVSTNPSGAELWLDNRSVALTPASLMLRVGQEVNVRLTRVGYVEHVETLVPERGKPINIDFVMEKTLALLEQEQAEKAALEAAEDEQPGELGQEQAAPAPPPVHEAAKKDAPAPENNDPKKKKKRR